MQSDSSCVPEQAGSAPAPSVRWSDAARQRAFDAWLAPLAHTHGLQPHTLRLASADASFRRYLRVQADAARGPTSRIIMDAPPPLEDVRPFVAVARLIRAAGLNAPEVLAEDPAQGFLLLGDLGDRLLLQALRETDEAGADRLMREAMTTLVRFQAGVPACALPSFGAATLREELALFPEWCVQREHGISWDEAQRAQWEQTCDRLVTALVAQPVVAVHRDWMPRNLMLDGAGLGILDFQDAAAGPIAYDVVSMLRDAFVSWEEEQEIDWAIRYWEAARRAGLPVDADFGDFWRAIEWAGLQRHLRILGVFCRLKHRDGKPGYAEDLPRFFGYCTRVAMRYREFAPLLRLLEPMSGRALQAGYTF
jgi:aminoglycoside/choline kinase family phosphotransferase